MKRFVRIVFIVFMFIVFAYLPVVPISIAPVVLNSTYSFRMVNLSKIFLYAIVSPEGVSYQWYWYTYFVILVLLAIGCLVSVLVFRKTRDSSNN